jgi:4-alpha-glucanotransferase
LDDELNDRFQKPDMQRVEEKVGKGPITKKLNKVCGHLKKISFHLQYNTSYGQEVFVYGNHPLLGNGQMEHALPMLYLNDSSWVHYLDWSDATYQEVITYHYFIKNTDGTKIFDWGEDKCFDASKVLSSELILLDAWNYAGYVENVFYTEPFARVLLKQTQFQKPSNGIEKNTTHIFRIKSPLLEEHQTICIIGEEDVVGAWDVKKALPLTKIAQKPYFEISLNLSHSNFPFVYKYGVYDTANKVFVDFEFGNNRLLDATIVKDSLVVINDGFVHLNNTKWKGAGIAIPVFSLKSKESMGVGEFGDIKLLVDWSKKIGLKLIQLLPVNDTTATHTWMDSYPYAAISAFALHPMFIRIKDMLHQGQENLLKPYDGLVASLNALPSMDYTAVMDLKWKLLRTLYKQNGAKDLASEAFQHFFKQNEHWLVSYSAFSYLRELHGTVDFNHWATHSKYDASAIQSLTHPKSTTYSEIEFYYFVQYHLHFQLSNVTKYAHENGLVIKGDIPIGVYRYGADAWQHPNLFHMDMQAGAPPDDFAVRGQNWGFPTYNWEVMAANNFNWWKLRFEQMSYYFDAFRIDHILGFFRIWSIPMQAIDGIMGHFVPAIPVGMHEFNSKGISFDRHRFTKPFINDAILFKLVGEDHEYIKTHCLKSIGDGNYDLLPAFQTQRKVADYFASLPKEEWHEKIKNALFDLISNVILIESDKVQEYHFRFNIEGTSSFQYLEEKTKKVLREMYINYFFNKQEQVWEKEAMQKLPMLKRATNMLIFGEDLGLVPSCLPPVMHQLGILSLEVQRMPKVPNTHFFNPKDAPYLSVVTPSSHDTSTIRGWWEENRDKTQSFYNQELGKLGQAPPYCEPWINKAIMLQHLYSPAMWSIFQLQDFLGVDEKLRRENPNEERINEPANPKHYWRYRMHIGLEDLIQQQNFNQDWHQTIKESGR